MSKPDASQQFKRVNIFRDIDAFAADGPWCVNCELGFRSFEDMTPDCPFYFCSPLCARDWESQQPLQNLLNKRKARRERDKPPA